MSTNGFQLYSSHQHRLDSQSALGEMSRGQSPDIVNIVSPTNDPYPNNYNPKLGIWIYGTEPVEMPVTPVGVSRGPSPKIASVANPTHHPYPDNYNPELGTWIYGTRPVEMPVTPAVNIPQRSPATEHRALISRAADMR